MSTHYEYSIEFVIQHSTEDPSIITQTLGIDPSRSTMAGSTRRCHSGPSDATLAIPAQLTTWSCWLHRGPRMQSPEYNPGDTILKFLESIRTHESYLRGLLHNGSLYLWICVFCDSGNAAVEIGLPAMALSVSMGIELFVDFYSTPQGFIAT